MSEIADLIRKMRGEEAESKDIKSIAQIADWESDTIRNVCDLMI